MSEDVSPPWGTYSWVDGRLRDVFATKDEAIASLQKVPPQNEVRQIPASEICKLLSENSRWEVVAKARIMELENENYELKKEPQLDPRRVVATTAGIVRRWWFSPGWLATMFRLRRAADGAKPYLVDWKGDKNE